MSHKMYRPKGKPTLISADVKMTINVRNDYFSVSAHEERTFPENEEIDLDMEWQFLYEHLHDVAYEELQEIKDSFKRKR